MNDNDNNDNDKNSPINDNNIGLNNDLINESNNNYNSNIPLKPGNNNNNCRINSTMNKKQVLIDFALIKGNIDVNEFLKNSNEKEGYDSD